jgi:hypothetical protein
MQVDTGSFRALTDQVAAIEAEVAELRRAVVFTSALGDGIAERAYREGRESILGRPAAPRPARPRHLQAVDGGQP